MKTVFPPVAGIHHMRIQSLHGPELPEGRCLGTVAEYVLGHPSGAECALDAWHANHRNHPWDREKMTRDEFYNTIPRGFPVSYDGGTPIDMHDGKGVRPPGHVLLSGVHAWGWSEDRLRTGYYDRIHLDSILTWNANPEHAHHLLGWSEDIAGFMLPYRPHSKDAHPAHN